MSLFITFEGGEGSGKSTQARELARRLGRDGLPVVRTQEPGGTPLGAGIRRWLKWSRTLEPRAELLLFAASRTLLVTQVIRPALERGDFVVCDRFTESTVAYQGYGRGLALEMIAQINTLATGGLRPDLIVLLDLPIEAGLARKRQRRDRFEREQLAFHRRVREGYRELAKADPGRWLVVDATLPKRQVSEAIWRRVEEVRERQRAASPVQAV